MSMLTPISVVMNFMFFRQLKSFLKILIGVQYEIEKGRFSFRLTAPYREERRRAASEAAKNE